MSQVPDNPLLRAIDAHRAGHLELAEAGYRQYLQHHPAQWDVYYYLGNLLAHQQRREEAIPFLETAAGKGQVDACYDLACCLEQLGQNQEAQQWLQETLRRSPDHALALNQAGRRLNQEGQFGKARALLLRAVRSRPELAAAHINLAVAHEALGDLGSAEDSLRVAIALNPANGGTYISLGNILRRMGRIEAAETAINEGLRRGGPRTEGLTNLALVHRERRELDNALALLDEALATPPKSPRAAWNRALILLEQGSLAEGWEAYESGFDAGTRRRPPTAVPVWQQQPLADKHIVVSAEQGLGDEIMFASCLNDLMDQAGECAVECDPRLIPLYRRSFGACTLIARDDARAPAWRDSDLAVALGSLPRHLRRRLEDFPSVTGFLCADREKRERWTKRLAVRSRGIHIGLVWRGGADLGERRKRSIPLHRWGSLLSSLNADYVCLQTGDTEHERQQLQRDSGITLQHWPDVDLHNDIDELAALLEALDLIISVDNTIIHLGGALGRPVWALLPFAADWRWMGQEHNTVWYPSVRLFRQRRRDDWSAVFDDVAASLRRLEPSS